MVEQRKIRQDDAYFRMKYIHNSYELFNTILTDIISRDEADVDIPLSIESQQENVREELLIILHWVYNKYSYIHL